MINIAVIFPTPQNESIGPLGYDLIIKTGYQKDSKTTEYRAGVGI
jgi:hypothetical protein